MPTTCPAPDGCRQRAAEGVSSRKVPGVLLLLDDMLLLLDKMLQARAVQLQDSILVDNMLLLRAKTLQEEDSWASCGGAEGSIERAQEEGGEGSWHASSGEGSIEVLEVDARRARNGHYYTIGGFQQYYGDTWRTWWDEAGVSSL